MDLGIKGKKALITGAGRGIGHDIALALASEGVRCAVVSRTESDLDKLVLKLNKKSKGHFKMSLDFLNPSAAEILTSRLAKDFGVPDIIIHNVGGDMNIKDPFCSIEDYRKVWRLNFDVAAELNLLLLPALQKKKWGRVVHISSIASVENQGTVPYCSAKAALNAYTRSMGRFVAKDGVIMTAVLPGAIFTDKGYWDKASKERPEHVKKFIQERMAIKRFGRLEEISKVVLFLSSQHASFCVGSIVSVDGGQGRGFFF